MEEVVDLANYARYTFIKLWFIQQYVIGDAGEEVSTGQMPVDEFKPLREMWGK